MAWTNSAMASPCDPLEIMKSTAWPGAVLAGVRPVATDRVDAEGPLDGRAQAGGVRHQAEVAEHFDGDPARAALSRCWATRSSSWSSRWPRSVSVGVGVGFGLGFATAFTPATPTVSGATGAASTGAETAGAGAAAGRASDLEALWSGRAVLRVGGCR